MEERTLKPVVLVVDDEKNIRNSIEIILSQEGIDVLHAPDAIRAFEILREQVLDLIILDIRLGEIDGLTAYKKFLQLGVIAPCVFMSGHATLTEAVMSVRLGAFDFIEKPFSAERVLTTVRRGLEFSQLKEKLASLAGQKTHQELVGDSKLMQQVRSEALRVAQTDASVFISGESGTGKELLCEYIHSQSIRRDRPLVKVNCSAIPDGLLESELFGYEKGAFTGAVSAKRGFFEQAHRGTIFLDEVADLSLAAQAKLLRVLQSGEIQKLGVEKCTRIDARIISASHKNLKQKVAEGSFREDLYYRLSVVPLRTPSLREHSEDIPLLFQFFVHWLCQKNNLKPKTFESDFVEHLKSYSWPGNVREFQNVIERVLIMSGSHISSEDLPEEILSIQNDESVGLPLISLKTFRDRTEREYVITVLNRNVGNITQSAKELGVARTYLHKRIHQLGIAKKDYSDLV